MAVATLVTRPTFQAWSLSASQVDDEACHYQLQCALDEIIAAATEHNVTIPASWLSAGDRPGPARNTINDVAAWLEAHDTEENSLTELTEDCVYAWTETLQDISTCRDHSCMCGYDLVESSLGFATEQLSELEDAAGHTITWWGFAERELKCDLDMDASALLRPCHRGDGFSWFSFDVSDDGHISASCEGGRIELYPLDGNRHMLAVAVYDFGVGDENTAAKMFVLSDEAAMIASTLVADMDDADAAGNINDLIDAAVLLADRIET